MTDREGDQKMATHRAMPAKSPIGTEHEYSINDKNFGPCRSPTRSSSGSAEKCNMRCSFGGIYVSKELQKHAWS